MVAVLFFTVLARSAHGEEPFAEEPRQACALETLKEKWHNWPPSEKFKITVEYRNYTYFEDESRGDSRDSRNEGRLRVEYDDSFRDNMRLYLNALLQADDDSFTHGFVDDFEDDDLKRNYFNFTEAFLDIYFDDFDLRLGKQIITWGKADAFNPTDNLTPTDYANLLDDDEIGVVAVNLNYYWRDWNLQIVGVPGFTPTRLPPRDTRFSLIPPDTPLPVEDPELPSNTIDNAQFGVRAKTTYRGWDYSISYYDGVNDIPVPALKMMEVPVPPFSVPVSVVPVYNRFRAVGADFATVFGRWGLHGEMAHLVFDGDRDDARLQYVLGIDYTKSDIIFDHDLFVIIEYVGEEVTEEGERLDTGTTPVDRILMSAIAFNIEYELTEFTKLEVKGAVDFHQGDDYYFQPQFVHDLTDNFEIRVGLDVLGGPRDTFFGQFKDNDRVFLKLTYTF